MTAITNTPVIASEQSDRSNLLVNSGECEIAASTLKNIFFNVSSQWRGYL